MNTFNRSRGLILFIFTLLLSHAALAQAPAAPTNEQVVAKINEYMTAFEKIDRFSGTILVARDGKPIFSKGYGMANYEWDIPNSPQTIFRLGSITKQFTSASIMLLQERGKLSTSDPICKYVTECPTAWEPITLKHLLTHTSGISNYTSFPDFAKKAVMPIAPVELLADYKTKPLDFAPGEKYNYTNSGYHLLGLVVEKASGKSYTDFLQENIFTPLGLTQTGYDVSETILKRRANGYVKKGDGFANAAYMDMLIPYAAGALYSTTEDLLKWEQALYTDKLLTQKSRDEMFTPFKSNYAYGWNVGKRGNRMTISHGGGIYGFATSLVRYPEEKVTVVVLSNVQGGPAGPVAGNLGAIVFGEPYTLPKQRVAITLPSQALDKFVGDYQLLPGTVLTVTNEGGKLFMKLTGNAQNLELFPESDKEFFLKVVDAQLKFETDTAGKVTQVIFKQGAGNGIPAPKIK
ncbi:MAG TPA: serine hydrolase [Pyrinomonadaceae bacterium]|nr:serine hydrolase [Pyrinomonadaceae bacterium]